jgi:type IV pilus assembly protein PilV
MNTAPGKRGARGQRGIGMLEVLIAVVVLSIGLIGMASLQISGLRFNRDAFLRSQATVLIYDVIEQMRIDSVNAIDNGAYSATYAQAQAEAACNPSSLDVSAVTNCWQVYLRERIPGASLSVAGPAGTDNNEFTVSLTWSDTWRATGGSDAMNSVQAMVVQL